MAVKKQNLGILARVHAFLASLGLLYEKSRVWATLDTKYAHTQLYNRIVGEH